MQQRLRGGGQKIGSPEDVERQSARDLRPQRGRQLAVEVCFAPLLFADPHLPVVLKDTAAQRRRQGPRAGPGLDLGELGPESRRPARGGRRRRERRAHRVDDEREEEDPDEHHADGYAVLQGGLRGDVTVSHCCQSGDREIRSS